MYDYAIATVILLSVIVSIPLAIVATGLNFLLWKISSLFKRTNSKQENNTQ